MLNILNYVSQNILVLSNNTHASSKDAWWETSALTTHWKSDCFATRAVSLYMKAVREMMIPVRNDTQAACIQDDPWKKKTDLYLNTDFKMQERARASFQCRQKKKTQMKKSKSKWILLRVWQCHEDVCCRLNSFHGWGNNLRRGKKKKRKWKKHPWQLMAMAELTQGDWRVSLNKQLTEREWRRPLTWLDRLRDAVRLPASWGDENIQPHSVNKYLKTNLLFFFF